MKLPNKRRSNRPGLSRNVPVSGSAGRSWRSGRGNALRLSISLCERAKEQTDPALGRLWIGAVDALLLEEGYGILEQIQKYDLNREQQGRAYQRLDLLHRLIHKTPLISCYTERDQDLGRVLDIFIRMNSGGTVLSYSDLLFSIAVANWQELDARREVNELVETLNSTGTGFAFSKDFVLKAGLMLAEIKSVGIQG